MNKTVEVVVIPIKINFIHELFVNLRINPPISKAVPE